MQHRLPNLKNKKGFSLILAVFIIVILSLAINYIVNLSTLMKDTVIYAINHERAYYAALSGAEWGVFQATQNSSCASSTSFNLPTGSTGTESALGGYAVTVNCNATSVTEGTSSYQVFEITSVASRSTIGTVDYSSRTVVIKATDL